MVVPALKGMFAILLKQSLCVTGSAIVIEVAILQDTIVSHLSYTALLSFIFCLLPEPCCGLDVELVGKLTEYKNGTTENVTRNTKNCAVIGTFVLKTFNITLNLKYHYLCGIVVSPDHLLTNYRMVYVLLPGPLSKTSLKLNPTTTKNSQKYSLHAAGPLTHHAH